ncbi:MAG TPA: hypothetical protein VE338_20115, partial [Ktedonobacterales bacterium]|nr:hypothetical protein [Ktedonobacterales bacterium]
MVALRTEIGAVTADATQERETLVERPEIRLRYLSGAPHEPVLRWRHGGLMFTPAMRNRTLPLGEIAWAADNGCFTAGARFKDT